MLQHYYYYYYDYQLNDLVPHVDYMLLMGRRDAHPIFCRLLFSSFVVI